MSGPAGVVPDRVRRGVRGAHVRRDCVLSRAMSYIPQLLESLDRRLDDLTTEIGALEAARAALEGRRADAPSRTVTRTSARTSIRRRPSTLGRTGPVATPASGIDDDGSAEPAAAEKDVATPVVRKPRRRAAPRTRRSVGPLDTGALERMLADTTAGLSAGAVAERAGAGYDRVLTLLRKLEAAGRVRRTGARRSTRWRLVSDEERIAQRAAELDAQVRTRRDDRTRRRSRARAT